MYRADAVISNRAGVLSISLQSLIYRGVLHCPSPCMHDLRLPLIRRRLIERVPPERPELMEASKGVFAEISLSEMRNEMHDKLRRARELDTFPPR